VHLHLGASGYRNVAGHGAGEVETIRGGGFGGVGIGRLAWLFEYDAAIDDAAGTRVTSTAAYHELSIVAARGLQLGLVYDFQDPDVTIHGDGIHRFGVDASIFPWPATEVQVIVRDVAGNPGNPVSRLLEAIAVLHAYL
jgi:hypothetical protein